MPTTTNMNMELPTVGVTIDPTWASNLNDALTNKVDLHDHTTGLGVRVPSAGLNINADLSFQSNDATNLRSVALNNNVATLPSGDIRALYASGGNLYYNNNSGTPIQITTGSSLNTGALALNVWELTELAGNLTILSSDSFVVINTDTTSARTINLPAASAVTAGRYFTFKDKTGDAATNNITIVPNGSDTIDETASSTTVNTAYGSLTLISDGVSNWLTNASLGGFVKLGGDLLGTGSTVLQPRVGSLTGIGGLITFANNTALNTRNLANDTNVNIAKINTSDKVLLSDTAFDTTLQGSKVTISSASTNITLSSNTSTSIGATTSLSVSAGTSGSITTGTALTLASSTSTVGITGNTGVTATATTGNIALSATAGTAALTAGSGAVTVTGSTNASVVGTAGSLTLTGGTTASLTASGGALTISAPSGAASMTGNTDVNVTATTGDINLSAGDDVTISATDTLTLAGRTHLPAKAVTSSPYTVDTTTKDFYILVDTSAIGGNAVINLPTATTGRMLVIKDVGGMANTDNIVLTRAGSESIDGYAGNYIMNINYQSVVLANYGGDWFTVASDFGRKSGEIVKILYSGASTTSTTLQDTNLAFDAIAGDNWCVEVVGGITTQAGNGGQVYFEIPTSANVQQTVFSVGAAPNYGVVHSPVTIDTDGAAWPFRLSIYFSCTTAGTATFQFKSVTGGDNTILSSGTYMVARRGVTV